MMKRNIFRVETGLRSFVYPVLKIGVLVVMITLVLFFACLLDVWVKSEILIFLFDLLATAILIACLFGIGVAGAEIDATIENREKDRNNRTEEKA